MILLFCFPFGWFFLNGYFPSICTIFPGERRSGDGRGGRRTRDRGGRGAREWRGRRGGRGRGPGETMEKRRSNGRRGGGERTFDFCLGSLKLHRGSRSWGWFDFTRFFDGILHLFQHLFRFVHIPFLLNLSNNFQQLIIS
jgi:hypothetical protein